MRLSSPFSPHPVPGRTDSNLQGRMEGDEATQSRRGTDKCRNRKWRRRCCLSEARSRKFCMHVIGGSQDLPPGLTVSLTVAPIEIAQGFC